MKKTITLLAIGMLSSFTSFGQGHLIFGNSGGTAIRENFSTSGGPFVLAAGTVRVGIFWNSLPGQTIPDLGNLASGPSTSTALGWSSLNAPGWNWATNSASPSGPTTALTRIPIPTTGTFAGGSQEILGTSPGQAISIYVIGWDSTFASPFNAAAAGSVMGWSNPFNLTLGAVTSPGGPFQAVGMTGFYLAVPEPTTFTLAGLGAAMLWIVRRRK